MEQPNLLYIESMSNGDTSFEEKIITIIRKELPEEKEVYFSNIKSKNYIEAASNVHKLKHKISIFGLEQSYRVAEQYEADLLDGKDELSHKFEAILEAISNYLKQL